jgi:hypothetical protein
VAPDDDIETALKHASVQCPSRAAHVFIPSYLHLKSFIRLLAYSLQKKCRTSGRRSIGREMTQYNLSEFWSLLTAPCEVTLLPPHQTATHMWTTLAVVLCSLQATQAVNVYLYPPQTFLRSTLAPEDASAALSRHLGLEIFETLQDNSYNEESFVGQGPNSALLLSLDDADAQGLSANTEQ